MSDIREAISVKDRQQFLTATLEALQQMRKVILGYWERKNFNVDSKDDASPVTQADLQSEEVFRKFVSSRFPNHGIIGEEFPSLNPDSEFQWTVDPIDGTQNFALGIPTFGTMISLRFQNKPIIGLIENPVLNRRVHAVYGMGTFLNDERVAIKDSDYSELPKDAVILISTRAMFQRTNEGSLFDTFMQQHEITRIYYDCFGHSLVAAAQAPAMVEFNVRMWDASPTEILVQEAGGAFEYIREQPKIEERNFLTAIFGKPNLVNILKGRFKEVGDT